LWLRALAKSKPDGYTFGLVPVAGTAIATVTYTDLPDIHKDFVTIAGIADAPHMLVVPKSLHINTVEELVAELKKNPGKHNYASQGSGSLSHLEAAVFLDAVQASAEHVPYKGSSEAIPGLINGDTSLMYDSVASVLPHVKAGTLVPLATAASRRVPQLPDVPTASELGINLEADNAFVLLASAGTPADIVKVLTNAVEKALQDEAVKSTLQNTGIVPRFTAPAEFKKTIDHDFSVWPPLVKKLAVPIDSKAK
jgi:tripartite-type tricarboxylate transporter receptor subunit TctC